MVADDGNNTTRGEEHPPIEQTIEELYENIRVDMNQIKDNAT